MSRTLIAVVLSSSCLAIAGMTLAACGGDGSTDTSRDDRPGSRTDTGAITDSVGSTDSAGTTTTGDAGVEVVAVGDIACSPDSDHFNDGAGTDDRCRHQATAKLATSLDPDAVLLLGDIQYEHGTPEEYRASFDPAWGKLKDVTYPATGNHEYLTDDAEGYYDYFGSAAGDRDRGYYSFDLGSWHLVALNSNCVAVGGCDVGSPQQRWLVDDLRQHERSCTLAYWHHPRFSSGVQHGSHDFVADLWATLDDAGAEVVLAGHEHNYERFAPQHADGTAADAGIRGFVVGTGGVGFYKFGKSLPTSVVRNSQAFGVLRLELLEGRYRWNFEPVEGSTWRDSGEGRCGV